jgi:hypothetical protein
VDDGDPVLLALVLDDTRAPKVLAWWKAEAPMLAEVDALLPTISLMVGSPESMVRTTLDRCRTAGLLRDGGISPTAEKWLGSIVAKSLGGRGSKVKR